MSQTSVDYHSPVPVGAFVPLVALAHPGLVVGPGLLGHRLLHLLLERVRERAVVALVQALAPILRGCKS